MNLHSIFARAGRKRAHFTNLQQARVDLTFRRSIHASSVLKRSIFGGLFRRNRGSIGPDGLPRMSLLDQSSIPEDLRLPKPADPVHRIGAGLLDLILSGLGGSVAGAAVFYASGGAVDLAVSAAQGSALLLWVLRDGLSDEGNRSFGKRAFKLELTTRDGTLAQPSACLARNAYFLIIPVAGMHPYLSLSLEVLLFWDCATLFLTPDARKVGDYALGLRVVNERPGREERVLDMHEAEEVRNLRERIEKDAPGVLAARERADPTLAWYENTQTMLASLYALPGAAAARKAAADRTKNEPQRPTLYDTTPLASQSAGSSGVSSVPPMGEGLFAEVRDTAMDAPPGATVAQERSAGSAISPGTLHSGGRALYVNKPRLRKG